MDINKIKKGMFDFILQNFKVKVSSRALCEAQRLKESKC